MTAYEHLGSSEDPVKQSPSPSLVRLSRSANSTPTSLFRKKSYLPVDKNPLERSRRASKSKELRSSVNAALDSILKWDETLSGGIGDASSSLGGSLYPQKQSSWLDLDLGDESSVESFLTPTQNSTKKKKKTRGTLSPRAGLVKDLDLGDNKTSSGISRSSSDPMLPRTERNTSASSMEELEYTTMSKAASTSPTTPRGISISVRGQDKKDWASMELGMSSYFDDRDNSGDEYDAPLKGDEVDEEEDEYNAPLKGDDDVDDEEVYSVPLKSDDDEADDLGNNLKQSMMTKLQSSFAGLELDMMPMHSSFAGLELDMGFGNDGDDDKSQKSTLSSKSSKPNETSKKTKRRAPGRSKSLEGLVRTTRKSVDETGAQKKKKSSSSAHKRRAPGRSKSAEGLVRTTKKSTDDASTAILEKPKPKKKSSRSRSAEGLRKSKKTLVSDDASVISTSQSLASPSPRTARMRKTPTRTRSAEGLRRTTKTISSSASDDAISVVSSPSAIATPKTPRERKAPTRTRSAEGLVRTTNTRRLLETPTTSQKSATTKLANQWKSPFQRKTPNRTRSLEGLKRNNATIPLAKYLENVETTLQDPIMDNDVTSTSSSRSKTRRKSLELLRNPGDILKSSSKGYESVDE